MPELKLLSREAVPAALEKAMRYRLLNEPAEAESICLDVLKTDPDNQEAIITLLLALTDRFTKGYGVSDAQAKDLLSRIKSEYERTYYAGIFAERRGKTKLTQNTPGCRFQAYELFREAMSWFEKAEAIRAPESLNETSWFRAKKKSQSNFRWNEVIVAAMVRWRDERRERFYFIRTRRLGTCGQQVRFRVVVTDAAIRS